MVPCKPLDIFECEYGKEGWKTPLHNSYKWLNYEDRGDWTDEQWTHAIKFYNKNGFDKQGTIDYIKERFSTNYNVSLDNIKENEDEF
jgi:hypothetical protein